MHPRPLAVPASMPWVSVLLRPLANRSVSVPSHFCKTLTRPCGRPSAFVLKPMEPRPNFLQVCAGSVDQTCLIWVCIDGRVLVPFFEHPLGFRRAHTGSDRHAATCSTSDHVSETKTVPLNGSKLILHKRHLSR